MATVGRGAEQYTVRFPDGLRSRIKAAADQNNRSMNAEIVSTLEEKYPDEVYTAVELLEFLQELLAPSSVEDRIDSIESLNLILQNLNVELEADLDEGHVIFAPKVER